MQSNGRAAFRGNLVGYKNGLSSENQAVGGLQRISRSRLCGRAGGFTSKLSVHITLSLMKRYLILSLLSFGAFVQAQSFSTNPSYRTCTGFAACEDGTRPLSGRQSEELGKLKEAIGPGVSEDVVSRTYRMKSGSGTPPLAVSGAPKLGQLHKATWYTTENQSSLADPHVDVFFVNGKAAWFKWYFDGPFKSVQVTYLAE